MIRAGVIFMDVNMTISSSISKNQYVANGVNVSFSYTFKIFDESDIKVILTDTSGADTVQTIVTHYSVSGVGNDAGGSVTFVTAPTNLYTVTLKRDEPFTQEIDYVEGDDFAADSHEEGLDRSTMRDQTLNEVIDRAVTLSEGSTLSGITLPSPEANKLIAWNGSANNLINATSVISSNLTVTGGTTDRELVDILGSFLTVLDFGAVGDGVTDDSAAFIAALATGKHIIVPETANDYLLTGTIPFTTGSVLDLRGATITMNADGATARGLRMPEGVSNAWIIGHGKIQGTYTTGGSTGDFNNMLNIGSEFDVSSDPARTHNCGVVGDILFESTGATNMKAIQIVGYAEDILIKGVKSTGKQNFALGCHWTGNGDQATSTLPTKTWHPHRIVFEDCLIYKDGSTVNDRGFYCSAGGHVTWRNCHAEDMRLLSFWLFNGDNGYQYAQNLEDGEYMNYHLYSCSHKGDAAGISFDALTAGQYSVPLESGADIGNALVVRDFVAQHDPSSNNNMIGITAADSVLLDNIKLVEETTGNTDYAVEILGCRDVRATGSIIAQKGVLIRECDYIDMSVDVDIVSQTPDATSSAIVTSGASETTTTSAAVAVDDTSVSINSVTDQYIAGATLRYNDGSRDWDMDILSAIDSGSAQTFTITPAPVAISSGGTVTLINSVKNMTVHDCTLRGARSLLHLDGTTTAQAREVTVRNVNFQDGGLVDIWAEHVEGLNVFNTYHDNGGLTTTTTTTYGILLDSNCENFRVEGAKFSAQSKQVKFQVYCNNSATNGFVDSCMFLTQGSTAGSAALVKGSSSSVLIGRNNQFASGVDAVEHRVDPTSWTPTYEAASGSPSITYGAQEGLYIKEGRLVIAWGVISTTAFTAAGSAAMRIGGLPYTATNTSAMQYPGTCCLANDFAVNSNPQSLYVIENTALIQMVHNASSDANSETNSNILETDFGTGSSDNELRFMVVYLTDE